MDSIGKNTVASRPGIIQNITDSLVFLGNVIIDVVLAHLKVEDVGRVFVPINVSPFPIIMNQYST